MKSDLLNLVKAIKETSEKLDIDPQLVTKKNILEATDLSEWQIRKLGSLKSVKDTYFPVQNKALSSIQEMRETKAYITKLEKLLGQKDHYYKSIENAIAKNLKSIKVAPYKANKNKDKYPIRREMVAVLNDTHYGLQVDSEEVGNCNKYGWTEACRRTALFTKELIEFKPPVRNQVDRLHLILNGDIISGIIHNLTGRDNDLISIQMNGALHILTHVLVNLAASYKEVKVYGISGNHDDLPTRREGGRVMSQKYDSWANMLFFALSTVFKDEKRISFTFPKTPYVFVDTIGGRIMAVHGDTVFSKDIGNPGYSLNVKGLSNAITRFNTGEINKGNPPIKMVLIGHTHVEASFKSYDGTKVFNAPSLSGVDSYAHNLSINTNLVGQVLFEVTKDHIFGDNRLIELSCADKDNKMDKIIPVYNRSLKWTE